MISIKELIYGHLDKILKKEIPVLETERLILRGIKFKDLYQVRKIINSEDAWMFDRRSAIDIYRNSLYCWVLTLKNDDNNIMGIVGANLFHGKGPQSIYYIMASAYKKQGYMLEAAREMIEFLFRKLKIKKLTANILSINENSYKLIEKLGFKKNKTMKTTDEDDHDYIVYEKVNPYL